MPLAAGDRIDTLLDLEIEEVVVSEELEQEMAEKDTKKREWPQSAASLGRRLRQAATDLRRSDEKIKVELVVDKAVSIDRDPRT